MRVNSSPRSASARAIRSGVSDSPKRMFSASVGLTWSTISANAPANVDAAQHLEALVGAAEVRLGVLDDAAEGLQRRARRARAPRSPRGRPAARRGRGSRRSAARADRALQVGAGERLLDRERIARVRARRAPRTAARRRARVRAIAPSTGSGFHGSPGPSVGNPARRGAQADEVAERGRVADARAEVGAVGERQHPGGDRRRRAAAGAAGRLATGPHGLRVAPKTALNVCEPAPNSGVFVLPITIAPAARRRSTSSESCSGHVRRRTAASRTSCASPPCPRGP